MEHEIQNIGNRVFCDGVCGKEFTDSTEQGGIMFGSKALCPTCAVGCEKSAAKYGESHHIKARCPDGMTYADWVRDVLRGGNDGTIEIFSF